jgi:uncharacterized protein (TIGR02271 family)
VDEREGNFRYLIVDIGFWIFGKKVLLPISLCRISSSDERVYAKGLSKEQAETLPELSDDLQLDYDYEEQVRDVYRTPASDPLTSQVPPVAPFGPMAMDSFAPLVTPHVASAPGIVSDETSRADHRDTYDYQNEPALYGLDDTDHQIIKLYEERLIANRKRTKTGEVEIGKRVATETARASVPIAKERVVIERSHPQNSDTVASPDDADFQEGEVVRMEVYAETPDIHKEAFVREEVSIRKEVEHEVVDVEESLRREDLDLDAQEQHVNDRR